MFNKTMMTSSLLIFLSVLLASAETLNIWGEFTKNPNPDNFKKCEMQIQDALTSKYKSNKFGEKTNTPTQLQLVENYQLYNKFLSLIRANNAYAIELGFQIRPLTGGGAREDLYVSLGKLIRKNPRLFLSMLAKYNIAKEDDFDSLILMYGDEFVDDINKEISETDKRIKSLEDIKDEQMDKLKQVCLKILVARKQYLANLGKGDAKIDEIGRTFEENPVTAFQMIKNMNVKDSMDLQYIFLYGMPNDNRRAEKISERIKMLEQVAVSQELSALKEECLKILKREKEHVLEIYNKYNRSGS